MVLASCVNAPICKNASHYLYMVPSTRCLKKLLRVRPAKKTKQKNNQTSHWHTKQNLNKLCRLYNQRTYFPSTLLPFPLNPPVEHRRTVILCSPRLNTLNQITIRLLHTPSSPKPSQFNTLTSQFINSVSHFSNKQLLALTTNPDDRGRNNTIQFPQPPFLQQSLWWPDSLASNFSPIGNLQAHANDPKPFLEKTFVILHLWPSLDTHSFSFWAV